MDKTKALQKLLNGTVSDEDVELLKRLLASGEISIGGDVNNSVITVGSGNNIQIIQLTPEALDRLNESVDTVARLRSFLQGTVSRLQSESLPWVDEAISLEAVYTQPRVILKPLESASQVLTLDALADARRCVLLLGEPGSGKTTALRVFGLRLAQECKVSEESTITGKIPVYVPLREYEELERRKPGRTPNRLLAFILRFLPTLPRPAQESLLENGQVALLFDGLDEIADLLLRDQIVGEIQDFVTGHLGQACQVIVTSRSASYYKGQGRLAEPFQTWTIAPLDFAEQKILAHRWLTALAGPTQGETLFAELLKEIAHRPALERALRSPLLMTILLAVYVATHEIEGPAQRYAYLVDVLLLRSKGIRGASPDSLEPAHQRELIEDKECLSWLAFRGLEFGGRMDRPTALRELAKLGLSDDTADRFLRKMEDPAGLIKIPTRLVEGLLTFTPHPTFQDFFAGYHLSLEWQKNPGWVRKFIAKHIALPDWEAPIGFCLGLIEQDAAWSVLMHTLNRAPLKVAKLLQDGLELTYSELPRQRRGMLFKRLRRRAWELLTPILGIPLLRLRLLAPNREQVYSSAFNRRQEAIEAAGEIKVSEFGPLMVQAALQVPWLVNKFTDAMVKMGSTGLWPELQDWLTREDGNFQYWARQVIIQWEGQEAQKVFKDLIQLTQWQHIGLEALVRQSTPESESVFQNALNDPALAHEALVLGLEYHRPGLIENGLNWLEQNPNDTYIFGRKLVTYLAKLPFPQAVAGMRRLLVTGTDHQRLRDLFESADDDVLLPLLAVFAEIFKGANEELQSTLDTAIYQMFKCKHLDSRYGDAPEVLEQVLLYSNRNVRQYICKQFSPRPLGDSACAELFASINVDAPYPAWLESMEVLEALPPIRDPWRERIIAKLRPGLQREETRFYISLLLARLDAHDKDVISFLSERASTGDVHAFDMLLRQDSTSAFPFIMERLSEQGNMNTQEAIARLGRIWVGLNTAQRNKAHELLGKYLHSKDWCMQMQVVDVLGQIRSRADTGAILELVSKGTLDPEEIMCGRALGRMGWYAGLEKALWAASQQGNEHICRTVVHAWRMSGEAQAGRYLIQGLGPSNKKMVAHGSYDAELANQYLRGQAAVELGWLAADLARRCYFGNLANGWASLAKELGRDGIEPLAQKALTDAQGSARPGLSLFDQSRQSFGAKAEILMYLCAAYDWSEVILALLIGEDTDTPAVWDRLTVFFKIENTSECLLEMQSTLATRLNWKGPSLPFDNLSRLHRQVEYGFQRMVYDFSNYTRRWVDWLDWQRDQLR